LYGQNQELLAEQTTGGPEQDYVYLYGKLLARLDSTAGGAGYGDAADPRQQPALPRAVLRPGNPRPTTTSTATTTPTENDDAGRIKISSFTENA
jgi:hypothetical protein